MRKLISLLLATHLVNIVTAQFTINGLVQDGATGEALIGATLVEAESTRGTVTDLEGHFTLEVHELPTKLIVNYLGYAPYEYEIQHTKFHTIQIGATNLELDEIMVTALGLKRSSKALGYAVQKLEGTSIRNVEAVNFLDNLAGKLAGVSITAGATGPGSTSVITIRGASSFANNNPLFVIDGTPVNNNTVINTTNERASGFQEVDFGNGAMDINPADIATISVLKGPGAAALYGTRAANGVIVINTKDGEQTNGIGISLDQTTYLESTFQLPQYQNTYGQGNNGAFTYVDGLGGGINDNITYSYGPRLDAGLLIPQFDSPVTLADGSQVRGGDIAVHGGAPITATPFIAHPDNVQDFYQKGLSHITNLAIANAYETGDFRLSLSNLHSTSIIPNVNYNRKQLNTRLNFYPNDRLKVSSTMHYIFSDSDNRPANGYGSENINYALTAWLGRQTNLESLKNYWQPGLEGIRHYSFNYTYFDNPYFILYENTNAFQRSRLLGNLTATYTLDNGLSITLRSGMDHSNESRAFRRAFSTNRFPQGAYAEGKVFFQEINSDILVNYERNFGDFSLRLSAGGSRMDQQSAQNEVQASALAQPGVFQLSNTAVPLEIMEYESRKRINSVYSWARIAYRSRLFLEITGRNDWSSALAAPTSKNNTSFFYPSASLSYLLSRAIALPPVISFAKLRASWAQVGNDTAPYRTSGVFVAQTPFAGQPAFSDQRTLPNPDLLPEQTTSVELGADLRFLNDRLQFDFTWYQTLTKNQILSLPIALSSGYDQRILNGGSVSSSGYELVIGIVPVQSPRFQWQTNLNFSTNQAKVVSLPEAAGRLTLGYSRIYDNPNQTVWFIVEEGGRMGDIWGTGYLKNEAGAFIIGQDGHYIADNTLKKLGNYNPDFTLGITQQLRYQDWSLNCTLDWRQGGMLISRSLALAGVAGQLKETAYRPTSGIVAEGVINAGTAETPEYLPNTLAIAPESYYRQYYDRNHEENNSYDASYLKLRELSLSYRLGAEQLSHSFLRSVQELQISWVGRNLFALSEIPHFDPEQLSVQGQGFYQGVEDMSYPTTRSIGLKLGFTF